jgi:polar amino acid transport system permease protein
MASMRVAPGARNQVAVELAWADDDVVVVPRRRPGRWLAALLVLVLAVMAARSMAVNPNFQWAVVGQYLFSPIILSGLLVTCWLTLLAMAIASTLGVVLATAQMSDNPVVSSASAAYIWFFRGTPVLVQLIFWYNMAALYPDYAIGLPFMRPLLSGSLNDIITPWTAAVLALSLNEAAYMAEIIRGGLLSVDRDQRDAARALGMRSFQMLLRVTLPQAMRAIIPPTGNQTIGMLKGTSIVSIVALSDLLYSAQQVYARTFQTIPLLLVACAWYLVATTVLSLLQYRVERYFQRSDPTQRRRRPATQIERAMP